MQASRNFMMVIVGILLVALFFSIRSCSVNKSELKDANKALTTQKLDNQSFKETITKQGQKIYSQEQVILSDKKVIAEQIDKIEGLTKISQQIKVVTQTQIKEVTVPITEFVYIEDSLGFSYLRTPATFITHDDWYTIHGTIGDQGAVVFNDLVFRNKLTLSIGLKKRTFKEFITLRKRERTVAILDANPYSSITSMSNISVKESNRRFGLGIVGGYGLTQSGLSPFVGVGLTYSIIQF